MSLTRKFLKALGLEDEKVEQIIDAHTEVTDALKTQIKEAQDEAGSLADVTKERDSLKAKVADLEAKAPDAAKVQADFDAYKATVESEKSNAQKATLFQQALAAAGVARESAQKALLKVVDLSAVKLTKDGKLEGADGLITPLKTDYADFFATTTENGLPSTTPPAGGGKGVTKEQYAKMNVTERAALAANEPQTYAALKGE